MPVITSENQVITFSSEAELEAGLNDVALPIRFDIVAKGGFFTAVALDGIFISQEAQDAIDRMTGLVTQEESALIKFVNSQSVSIGSGNYGLLFELYLHVLFLEANGLTGLKSLTAINNGALHEAGGFHTDGIATFVNTNFNPVDNGAGIEPINSMGLIHLSQRNQNDNNEPSWGVLPDSSAQARLQLQVRSNFNYGYALTGDNEQNTGIEAQDGDLVAIERVAIDHTSMYVNGEKVFDGSNGRNSSGYEPADIYLGARNNESSPTSQFVELTAGCWGWAEANGFDQHNFNANYRILLDDLS